jgi:hypothetical protein
MAGTGSGIKSGDGHDEEQISRVSVCPKRSAPK